MGNSQQRIAMLRGQIADLLVACAVHDRDIADRTRFVALDFLPERMSPVSVPEAMEQDDG